ncbi:MAG: hypothetical protein AB2722_14490 [Candidatus Thiodiazotropha sp.]
MKISLIALLLVLPLTTNASGKIDEIIQVMQLNKQVLTTVNNDPMFRPNTFNTEQYNPADERYYGRVKYNEDITALHNKYFSGSEIDHMINGIVRDIYSEEEINYLHSVVSSDLGKRVLDRNKILVEQLSKHLIERLNEYIAEQNELFENLKENEKALGSND